MDRRTFVKAGLATLVVLGFGIRQPKPLAAVESLDSRVDAENLVVDWRTPMVPSAFDQWIVTYDNEHNFILSTDGGRTWEAMDTEDVYVELLDYQWFP